MNQALTQLLAIRNCQLGAILLVPQLDISEVTEIFVRINSQGKRLNESDFAMSKIAADEQYGGNMLRKAIDYFCHLSVEPSFYAQIRSSDHAFIQSEYASKLSWLTDSNDDIYDPDYNDMLRVSFMHTFGRGKLSDLVSLLSGRDFKLKDFKEEIAESSFSKLKLGVINFMNEYNFNQFVLSIRSAGFVTPKLLNSKMTLDFAYTLFLLLKQNNLLPKSDIKRYVQKWFVFSTLTGRYISSPESQMDRDLRAIDTKGFPEFMKENEDALLSDTFWNVAMVQNLETSSINSPHMNAFLAAQVFSSDHSLFSNSARVSDLITMVGDVHHIFPKEYLKANGITDRSVYNQVANYAYLDTTVNIAIGKRPPLEYFASARAQCAHQRIEIGTITDDSMLLQNLRENCIPEEVFNMTAKDYPEFLQMRRKLMAEKIRHYYERL